MSRFSLLAAMALLTGCAPAASVVPSADHVAVQGTITLSQPGAIDFMADADPERDCQGAGDFAVEAGSQVIARDGAGNVVGTGSVEVGENAEEDVDNPSMHADDAPPCVMPFRVEIDDADFYTFSIAGWPVELVYSREDLEALDWTLELAPAE